MPRYGRRLLRKKSKATMIFFGSIVAVLGSLCFWSNGRKYITWIAKRIIMQIRLHNLAAKTCWTDIRQSKYNKIDLPLKPGGIAIVTGGSRGIGVEVVRKLMQSHMEVIIACRNTKAGDATIKKIRESGIKDGDAKVYHLDNSSLETVKEFADCIKRDYKKIDILINNAGVMFGPYGETKDGFENQWGINYVAHFLLTASLMPLLRNAGTPDCCSRVINVSSVAHYIGTINFEDINHKNQWLTVAAYCQSKLASVMFTKTLQRIFDDNKLNIRTYSVHPGFVDTDLFEHTPFNKLKLFTKFFFKSPAQGATPIVYSALSQDITDKGGIYISNCLDTPVNSLAHDQDACDRLFELSLGHAKLKNFLEYL